MFLRLLPAILISALPATSQANNESQDAAREMASFARQQFEIWGQDPLLLQAITTQNQRHSRVDMDEITSLDNQWRSQFSERNQPMIQDVMSNDLSRHLMEHVLDTQGRITEIIVMDAHGLNVAQTAITYDYYQGDEAKYQETYLKGPGSEHVSEIEPGESHLIYQSQVSLPVVDPATNAVVGAVTISVDAKYFY